MSPWRKRRSVSRPDEPWASSSMTPSDLAEATLYVQSLASNGQVEAVAGESPLGPTHAVETDAQGLRTLTRKRFTAY